MLEGITAGLILSLSLFPGTVRVAKVGFAGRARQVLAAGFGFALSQFLWLGFSIPGLMLMVAQLQDYLFVLYGFAAFVLGYLSYRYYRAKRLVSLEEPDELPPPGLLFRDTFIRSLAMPMRLPAAIAVLLATGAFINHPASWESIPAMILGAAIGVTWWWGQMVVLAILFARRVRPSITVRSLNKIRPFCAVLHLFLAGIALLWIE